jgi:chromosome segregation ATPase
VSNFFQDQFELLLGAISGIFGGAFGWIVGRRKNKAEGVSLELENIKTILEINRSELDNLKNGLNSTRQELQHCRQEMEQVLNERLEYLKKKANLQATKTPNK